VPLFYTPRLHGTADFLDRFYIEIDKLVSIVTIQAEAEDACIFLHTAGVAPVFLGAPRNGAFS